MASKLTPYQERLCKMRCEQGLSEIEIGQLLKIKHQTVRLHFLNIRQVLRMPTFDDIWRRYKKGRELSILERLEEKVETEGVELSLPKESYVRVVREGGKTFEEWLLSRIDG